MERTINIMYKKFAEECYLKGDNEYRILNQNLRNIEQELNKNMDKDQKKLLNQYSDIITELCAIEARESYKRGFLDVINNFKKIISSI